MIRAICWQFMKEKTNKKEKMKLQIFCALQCAVHSHSGSQGWVNSRFLWYFHSLYVQGSNLKA